MLYDLSVPQFTKMLKNLDAILVKATSFAESKKVEMNVLLTSRLAPDQFHLAKQIQIACDTAKTCVSKLTGKDAPVHDDTLIGLSDLRARIADVISFMGAFTEKDFSGAAERKVTTPRWDGKFLMGHEYITQHSIPNMYFHVTTAYAILRHNGLDIGKKDYLGPMPFKT